LNPEFETYPVNEIGLAKIKLFREAFDTLLTLIVSNLPPGRELSLVRTKLEEASFYAVKSLSKQLPNQKS